MRKYVKPTIDENGFEVHPAFEAADSKCCGRRHAKGENERCSDCPDPK